MNGELPLAHATFAAAVKIALCGVVLSVTNILLMFRVAQSYGYSLRKIMRIDGVDLAIYLLTVPYAVMTALSFAALGWSALIALAFIGSVADEKRIGVKAVVDTKPTESWLGVPMIARDRLIGVISVESFKKNAFTNDDMLLLTAIANQAAVAIENAHLYKDLEGLTYAL